MTNTQKLKVVAELLGWTGVKILRDGKVYGTPPGGDNLFPFRPDLYLAQLIEVEDWMMERGKIAWHIHDGKYYLDWECAEFTEVERFRAQAVINAAAEIGENISPKICTSTNSGRE